MTAGYPDSVQVESADQRRLMAWTRFLPSPDDEARPTLERILERQRELREADPAGYTAGSKSVGW